MISGNFILFSLTFIIIFSAVIAAIDLTYGYNSRIFK